MQQHLPLHLIDVSMDRPQASTSTGSPPAGCNPVWRGRLRSGGSVRPERQLSGQGFHGSLPAPAQAHRQAAPLSARCRPAARLCALQPVLSRPIDWELIRRQYDEMVKYTTALRLGTAEAEAILRRFTGENVQHPTYRALLEPREGGEDLLPVSLLGGRGNQARDQRRAERGRTLEQRRPGSPRSKSRCHGVSACSPVGEQSAMMASTVADNGDATSAICG